jgi:radical SAM superfamily enzyme YgiQ (UPF0313 family)
LTEKKVFHLVLIKPSHYDTRGYVIQWVRSTMPSNSLAILYGLALDCSRRSVLGEDVEFRIHAFDETHDRIRPDKLSRMIQDTGGHGLVAMVGVQSNQFPRAMDLARKFRSHDVQVCIGGFHVSGCLSMLPGIPDDLQEAMDLGISLFAGELEGRFDALLQDAYRRDMTPLHNYMDDLPGLEGSVIPFLPADVVNRRTGARASFDAGRGCPFQCSFCTIINVQGRKSRRRNADDVEHIIRVNAEQGITNFFISDDNFARNKDWESVLDRVIRLKEEEGIPIRLLIQVDTLCHKIKNFVAKCGRAGVDRVFIGLENINRESLVGAKKLQNRISEYRIMLQAWHSVGAVTYAGYILGFPIDTPESIKRDIGIIQRELPIDMLEFFILTPLPGSKDHQTLFHEGVEMDPDMNKYDVTQVTTAHPRMSKEEWQGVYQSAWDWYYTADHAETVMRRSKEWGMEPRKMLLKLLNFYATPKIEGTHPLEGGIFRKKYRGDRRPGLPIENPIIFYARYGWEILSKHAQYLFLGFSYYRRLRRVEKGISGVGEVDMAMVPTSEEDEEEFEILNLPVVKAASGAEPENEVAVPK